MCGVAGFSLSPNEVVNVKRLTRSLLLGIEHRGPDATGFAFIDSTGMIQVHKRAVTASVFVGRNLCVPKRTRQVIMHTRFATQGAPEWNANNHPILTGKTVGVHNGVIYNDFSLFAKLETQLGRDVQIAEVDSEAAFAMLEYSGKPVLEVLPLIGGSATLAWMQADDADRSLNLARVSSSPLIYGETEKGSVIFASTEAAVIAAAHDCKLTLTMLRDIPEGTYIRVVNGDAVDVNTFEMPKSYSYSTGHSKWRRANPRTSQWLDDYDYDDWRYNRLAAGAPIIMGPARDASTAPPRGLTTGDKLRTRLDAEEPEIVFEPDDDDLTYEAWWARNVEANESNGVYSLEEARDAKAKARGKFDDFLTSPVVNTYYLTDTTVEMVTPTESEYMRDDRHLVREEAIAGWSRGISCTVESDRLKVIHNLKGDARPGDRVVTEVGGCRCDGTIHALPDCFPAGDYIIRAFLQHPNRKGDVEAVFVARKSHEFQYDYAHPKTKADKSVQLQVKV